MSAAPKRWLSLVGIGEDGIEGLSPAARKLLAQAELVVGGARHLALAGPLSCETLAWPSPLTDTFPQILARRGRAVVVLASGDPFFYGVGTTLCRHVPAEEIFCLPQPSSFSLAASRLGWSQQDCALVTLHGRALERLIPHLRHGAKILALSWDGETPRKAAELLVARRFGGSRIVALEALGGPRENIRDGVACDWAHEKIDPLNVLAIDVVAGADARTVPRTPGLPDEMFEHDGQITKRDVRAITLSALAPAGGELLWDIGGGSGSVAIEWMLADPQGHAIAIEANNSRAARIRRNAFSLGTPDLQIVEGRAPDALANLPTPDAIFIGGGATAPGVVDAGIAMLRAGGRLVINAVTIETQALLAKLHGAQGGELVSIQIALAEKLGRFSGFRPAMPVVQWRWRKP
jgi:precorrin-6B C5,15-methyltransferase / cobalt-precorrin-6B C5,C15-methyltransferase